MPVERQMALIRKTTARTAKIPAAILRSSRSGSTRAATRRRHADPGDGDHGEDAPTNTDRASPLDARLAAASWVRSPHSARKTMPKTVAGTCHGSAERDRPTYGDVSRPRPLPRRPRPPWPTAPEHHRPGGEHRRHHRLHRPVGEQVEQPPGHHGDGHLRHQPDAEPIQTASGRLNRPIGPSSRSSSCPAVRRGRSCRTSSRPSLNARKIRLNLGSQRRGTLTPPG